MELRPHQKDAIELMRNGCILHGGTGVGKTFTALGYYVKNESPRDIYVITTARKRDSLDWEAEALHLRLFVDRDTTQHGVLTVDSWNNISKYQDVKNAFFIFDEHRAIGQGTWAKKFVKIARQNHWILLSATPGDTWMDYVPVFIANGFFKNITEFRRMHVLYEPFVKFPKVKAYLNEGKLERLRNELLIEMPYERTTNKIMNWVDVSHDKEKVKFIVDKRWHIYENRPLTDVSELYRVVRKLCNTDQDRIDWLRRLIKEHPRIILFYNFDYELFLLREAFKDEIDILEWNGHQKDEMTEGTSLLYLVQYTAGAEAWNCTTADAMVFWSLTYSYRNFHQAQGRIDRLDTLYTDLYYYMFVSDSFVDRRIRDALTHKENFNERDDARKHGLDKGWD
jgi:hypothetical protein